MNFATLEWKAIHTLIVIAKSHKSQLMIKIILSFRCSSATLSDFIIFVLHRSLINRRWQSPATAATSFSS